MSHFADNLLKAGDETVVFVLYLDEIFADAGWNVPQSALAYHIYCGSEGLLTSVQAWKSAGAPQEAFHKTIPSIQHIRAALEKAIENLNQAEALMQEHRA